MTSSDLSTLFGALATVFDVLGGLSGSSDSASA